MSQFESRLFLPGWRALARVAGSLLLAQHALVAQPTSAVIQPPSARASLGSSATFCVQAQGTGRWSYQWRKNGVNLDGETNVCLTLTNITVADGGSYLALVFTDTAGIATDEAILLIAIPSLPGEDQFTSATAVSVISNSVQGQSFGATREPGEPRHFDRSTSNSVWYTWTAPAGGIVTFNTRGSTFDTVLAVYDGASLGALTALAGDDDSGGFHTSEVSWNAEARRAYHVVIDGLTGEAGTYVCNWRLEATSQRLPQITLPPRNQTVKAGGTAVFLVAATNSDPRLSFQWFRNHIPIPGATSSNLTLLKVQTPDLGEYQVKVTNPAGRSVVSQTVVLEIGPDPTVQSRDKIGELPSSLGGGAGPFTAAAVGGFFSLAAGTTISQRFFSGGTADRCEPPHCSTPGGASRWFELRAESDGICMLDTQGSDVDTVLAVYLQNFSICTNLYEPLVDCNNDVVGGCRQLLGIPDRSSRLSFFATAGAAYRAVVDTVHGVHGSNVHFNVQFRPALSVPATHVPVGPAVNYVLPLQGSSLVLGVTTNFTLPGTTYQWEVNGRRIAGAGRDTLVLPFLNYSDAGQYSVRVQRGTNNALLPGAILSVVEPCQSSVAATSAVSGAQFQLFGVTPKPVVLEAAGALTTNTAWQSVGPILPSTEPARWDAHSGPRRFYRVTAPPP